MPYPFRTVSSVVLYQPEEPGVPKLYITLIIPSLNISDYIVVDQGFFLITGTLDKYMFS